MAGPVLQGACCAQACSCQMRPGLGQESSGRLESVADPSHMRPLCLPCSAHSRRPGCAARPWQAQQQLGSHETRPPAAGTACWDAPEASSAGLLQDPGGQHGDRSLGPMGHHACRMRCQRAGCCRVQGRMHGLLPGQLLPGHLQARSGLCCRDSARLTVQGANGLALVRSLCPGQRWPCLHTLARPANVCSNCSPALVGKRRLRAARLAVLRAHGCPAGCWLRPGTGLAACSLGQLRVSQALAHTCMAWP